jgi:hypothetical protein
LVARLGIEPPPARTARRPVRDVLHIHRSAQMIGVALFLVDRVRRAKEPPTVNTGKTPPTNPLTPGERRAMWIVALTLVCVIAGGATAWALTASRPSPDRSGDGCVTVTMASTMGGGLEHACGLAARNWCHAASTQHDTHAEAVQAQCRVAGLLP